jgi:hypothetical protein
MLDGSSVVHYIAPAVKPDADAPAAEASDDDAVRSFFFSCSCTSLESPYSCSQLRDLTWTAASAER